MTPIGDGPTEVWTAELRRAGRVVFPLRRRPVLRQGVSGPIVLLFLTSTELPRALRSGGPWPVLAVGVMTACVAGASFGIWQLVTLRPFLTVDMSGIRLGHRRFMAWDEIGAIAEPDGPPGDRFFVVSARVGRRKLRPGEDHVRNVPAFRYWLSALLEERRREAEVDPPAAAG
ncbi:hypothetical protein [Kribbella sp. C-35]|uniref:hypothetical protein n=1 Tax=Kribbella sp. C-35 TaxID=2789276 RepID=UPI00397C4800